MRFRFHAYALTLALLTPLSGGCLSEHHSEFRGVVTREGVRSSPVQRLGGQFHFRDENVADAVSGMDLSESQGIVCFIHDRAKYVGNRYRVTTDAVSAVYFADTSLDNGERWKPFIRLGEAERDGADGVHRLTGSFYVERWKSNIDFRIRLAMRSEGPQPVSIDGVLTMYETQEFRPVEWCAMALWSLGLISPTEVKPAR